MENSKLNLDPWGFINSLEGCRFISGLHMKDLTIEPPEGGRIGSDYVQKIKHVDELLYACKRIKEAVDELEKNSLIAGHHFTHLCNCNGLVEEAIAKAEGR